MLRLLSTKLFASFFFHFIGFGENLAFAKRRRKIFMTFAIAVIGILVVNAAIIAGLRMNWNNNWVQYEWQPLTEKQISVTQLSRGIEAIQQHSISEVPTGNVSKVLSLVRQWDKTAAYTKMRNQIGVNWMSLADSDIIYINGREYWTAPITIQYPSSDRNINLINFTV